MRSEGRALSLFSLAGLFVGGRHQEGCLDADGLVGHFRTAGARTSLASSGFPCSRSADPE